MNRQGAAAEAFTPPNPPPSRGSAMEPVRPTIPDPVGDWSPPHPVRTGRIRRRGPGPARRACRPARTPCWARRARAGGPRRRAPPTAPTARSPRPARAARFAPPRRSAPGLGRGTPRSAVGRLERQRLRERRAARIGRVAIADQLADRRVEPISSSPRWASARPGAPRPSGPAPRLLVARVGRQAAQRRRHDVIGQGLQPEQTAARADRRPAAGPDNG